MRKATNKRERIRKKIENEKREREEREKRERREREEREREKSGASEVICCFDLFRSF